jgi:hypothetical protein
MSYSKSANLLIIVAPQQFDGWFVELLKDVFSGLAQQLSQKAQLLNLL